MKSKYEITLFVFIFCIIRQAECFYNVPTSIPLRSPSLLLHSKPSPISRFTNPTIDDLGLPLADALIAGVVAPVSQVFICANRAYSPTWLVATLPPSTTLNRAFRLFPATLSHGAVLAILWTLGCLASKNYEKEAFGGGEVEGYGEPLKRTLQAGSVATALLILATQADLFFEFGRWVQPGESGEIDFRILTAFAEGLLDVGVEAVWLVFWRVYRTSITTRK